MILLDAYALVAYLRDEPAADLVQAILERETAAVVSVNLAEVLDHLRRRRGISVDEIARVVGPLLDEVLEVRSAGEGEAWRAAELRARYYRRRDAELSLADCLLLASVGEDDAVATADPVLAAAARAEGVRVVALPDSRGRVP